jgi:hypothetical protein
MQPSHKPTLIRAVSNYAAPDQDIQFAGRCALSPTMRLGCLQATRNVMASGVGHFDLGFHQSVLISVDSRIHGRVARAIGLIAYRDDEYDNLFFLYETYDGCIAAVMGDTTDISSAIDGWLDYGRYFDYCWDPVARERTDVFAVEGFDTLWADADGVIAGADIEGAVATVSKLTLHDSYARTPEAKLMRIGVQAAMHRASITGTVNAR